MKWRRRCNSEYEDRIQLDAAPLHLFSCAKHTVEAMTAVPNAVAQSDNHATLVIPAQNADFIETNKAPLITPIQITPPTSPTQ